MFIDVETFLFNAGIHSEAVQFLDAIEEDESTGGCPEVDDEDAEALGSEEAPSVTVEGTIARGEQTRQECAENAAHTMHRGGTHGVVDVQFVVDELDGENQHRSADESDDDGSDGRHEVATCRDAYESCQDAVERQ